MKKFLSKSRELATNLASNLPATWEIPATATSSGPTSPVASPPGTGGKEHSPRGSGAAPSPVPYIRLPIESAKKLKWYDQQELSELIKIHTEEQQQVFKENDALRALLLRNVTEEQLERRLERIRNAGAGAAAVRQSEDDVNRVLLLSAQAEVQRLREAVASLQDDLQAAASTTAQVERKWELADDDGARLNSPDPASTSEAGVQEELRQLRARVQDSESLAAQLLQERDGLNASKQSLLEDLEAVTARLSSLSLGAEDKAVQLVINVGEASTGTHASPPAVSSPSTHASAQTDANPIDEAQGSEALQTRVAQLQAENQDLQAQLEKERQRVKETRKRLTEARAAEALVGSIDEAELSKSTASSPGSPRKAKPSDPLGANLPAIKTRSGHSAVAVDISWSVQMLQDAFAPGKKKPKQAVVEAAERVLERLQSCNTASTSKPSSPMSPRPGFSYADAVRTEVETALKHSQFEAKRATELEDELVKTKAAMQAQQQASDAKRAELENLIEVVRQGSSTTVLKLMEQREELEGRLNTAQKAVVEKDTELRELARRLSEQEAQLADARKQLSVLDRGKAANSELAEKATLSSRPTSPDRPTSPEAKSSPRSISVSEKPKQVAELERVAEERRKSVESMSAELERVRSERSQQEQQASQVARMLNEALARISELDSTIHVATNRANELEQEVKRLTHSLAEATAACENLQFEQQEQLALQARNIAQLEEERHRELQKAQRELKFIEREREVQVGELKVIAESATSRLQELQADFERQMAQQQQMISELTLQRDKVERELLATAKIASDLERSSQQQAEALEAGRTQFSAEDDHEVSAARLATETEAGAAVSRWRNEAARLESERAQMADKADYLVRQVAELETELTAIQSEFNARVADVEKVWQQRCEVLEKQLSKRVSAGSGRLEEKVWESKYRELKERLERDALNNESAWHDQYRSLKAEFRAWREKARSMLMSKDEELTQLRVKSRGDSRIMPGPALLALANNGRHAEYRELQHPEDEVDATSNASTEEMERAIIEAAMMQALRENELQVKQQQIKALEQMWEDSEHTHELRDKAQQVLKAEINELSRSKTRESVDMLYLKNVVLKYMETNEQQTLLPVIARLLQFNQDEQARVSALIAARNAAASSLLPSLGPMLPSIFQS
eukprot:jgi/Chlat1/4214/Chrsp27S04296